MGYYAVSIEGNINIPYAKLSDLLNAVSEQYAEYNNDPLWGRSGELDAPKSGSSLLVELDTAGFDFENDGVLDDGSPEYLTLTSFDGKWRTWVEYLLRALMSVATPDSAMAFRGEDGEMWRFTKDGVQNATIVWK